MWIAVSEFLGKKIIHIIFIFYFCERKMVEKNFETDIYCGGGFRNKKREADLLNNLSDCSWWFKHRLNHHWRWTFYVWGLRFSLFQKNFNKRETIKIYNLLQTNISIQIKKMSKTYIYIKQSFLNFNRIMSTKRYTFYNQKK